MTHFPRLTPTLRVMRGDQILSRLTIDGADQPVLHAKFHATPAFDEYRSLFAEEVRLGQAEGEELDEDAWGTACDRIDALGLRLVTEDGEEIADFILHIDGERAWFRI